MLGQALLTKRMGKTRVIAETGAGQHGVASATAAAYFGLDCTVYMGAVDTKRQALNVARMQLLGAKVVPVDSGSATLKDAINEALRDWVASVDHTAYLFGTAAGPHPFPSMVRDFTRGIGDEARAAVPRAAPARLPDAIAACVGGGSNAIGLFTAFLDDEDVAIYGFEPGGDGVETGRHAATIHAGDGGRAARRPHLRAPGRGRPDHRVPLDLGRPRLPGRRPAARPPRRDRPGDVPARSPTPRRWTRWRCSAAPRASSRPSSPPTRSPARCDVAERLGDEKGPDATVLINLSGRGDKDMGTAIEWFGLGDADGPEPTRAGRMSASLDAPSRRPRAEAAPPWSATCRPASPTSTAAIEALRAMVDAGCDVIEVGLPYSDPVMDGPTIQAAAQQALEGGVRTTDVLRTVEAVAATGTPTVVMTYWNPVERYGVERFAADLAGAGGAGLITPDLTPDCGAGVDRRRRRARPRQGLPGRAVARPTSGSR